MSSQAVIWKDKTKTEIDRLTTQLNACNQQKARLEQCIADTERNIDVVSARTDLCQRIDETRNILLAALNELPPNDRRRQSINAAMSITAKYVVDGYRASRNNYTSAYADECYRADELKQKLARLANIADKGDLVFDDAFFTAIYAEFPQISKLCIAPGSTGEYITVKFEVEKPYFIPDISLEWFPTATKSRVGLPAVMVEYRYSGRSYLYVTPKDRNLCTRGSWGTRAHPHVLGDDLACLGSFEALLNESTKARCIVSIIGGILQFLRTVNSSDGAGAGWPKWLRTYLGAPVMSDPIRLDGRSTIYIVPGCYTRNNRIYQYKAPRFALAVCHSDVVHPGVMGWDTRDIYKPIREYMAQNYPNVTLLKSARGLPL